MTEDSSTLPLEETVPDEQYPKKHPRGLYLLYFTEMWERFSYYGMRAIFTLYMVNALLFDKAFASQVYGSYTGLVYLTPLMGGFISDKLWGNRRSIIVGGIMMAIGQFLMFTSASMYTTPDRATLIMFAGLTFLIIGNGFFKPNISTMLGQLYAEGDHKVTSAFIIFYQGINMGAMFAPALCGALGEQYDAAGNSVPSAFRYGFLAACIGMVISLIAFIWLKNKYVVTPKGEAVGMPVKNNKTEAKAVNEAPKAKMSMGYIIGAIVALIVLIPAFKYGAGLDWIGAFIFPISIVLPVLIVLDPSLTKVERERIFVIYIIAFFVIFFWSAFEQAGASLTFFASEQTDRSIFGWLMPASFFQIFNALFIVIFAPVSVYFWNWLHKKNMEPSSPVKQAIGLALLAIGYLYIAWGVHGLQPWAKVSMIWLVGLYFIHTLGELCLSPIGLSMVVKLAPLRFTSLLMGVWFMSNAAANKFAGTLSSLYPEEVKMETMASARADVLNKLQENPIDTAMWRWSADKSYNVPVAKLGMDKDEITSLEPTGTKHAVSVYHMKLIRTVESRLTKAVVSDDGKYLYTYKKDEQKTSDGVKVTEKVMVWNMEPEKPSFLGMKINTLYDFFMIFVYMAGAAAILLFAIHKWLLTKMHGVK
jgi:POT family proton-dependent oligopeptide transporter